MSAAVLVDAPGQSAEASGPPLSSATRPLALVLLLIVPAIAVLVGGRLEQSAGPRWIAYTYDPDYAYLLNAINVAEGRAPRHIDHPGTPLQVACGGLLVLRHWVRGADGPLRQEVLSDPEAALHVLSVAIRAFHAGALLAFGLAARRFTGSALCAVAAQGATVLSLAAMDSLFRVTPEPVALGLSLFLCGAVLMALSCPDGVRPRFAVLSGVLVAAGLATKVTFAPVCLVPWGVLLSAPERRVRLGLLHLLAAAAALIVFLAPILAQLGRVAQWFESLALNSGHYGTPGGHRIINPGRYGMDLWRQMAAEPATASIAVAGLLLALALFLPALARRLGSSERRWRAVLLAASTAQALEFVLVAKHPHPRYLIPAVGVSGLSVCLIMALVRAMATAKVRRVVAAAGIVAMVQLAWTVSHDVSERARSRAGDVAPRLALSAAAETLIKEGATVGCTYGSSSPANALQFADYWAGYRFAADLHRMFPGHVQYTGSGAFLRSGPNPIPDQELLRLASEGRLWFQGLPVCRPYWFEEKPLDVPGGPAGEALFRAKPTMDPP